MISGSYCLVTVSVQYLQWRRTVPQGMRSWWRPTTCKLAWLTPWGGVARLGDAGGDSPPAPDLEKDFKD